MEYMNLMTEYFHLFPPTFCAIVVIILLLICYKPYNTLLFIILYTIFSLKVIKNKKIFCIYSNFYHF